MLIVTRHMLHSIVDFEPEFNFALYLDLAGLTTTTKNNTVQFSLKSERQLRVQYRFN